VGRSDPRPARRATGLWLWTVAISIATPGLAAGSDDPDRSFVDVAIDASDAEADALVGALGDLVPRSGLRVRVERRQDPPAESSGPDDAVAGVWIDASAPDQVDIRVTSARGGPRRSYERSLPRDGSTAVVAEEVSQVIRAELESIRATEPAQPAPRAPDPPSKPASIDAPRPAPGPPRPALEAQSGVGIDLLAFVGERAVSSLSGPVLGAGVAADVSVGRVAWRPSLWVSAAYDARFDAMQTRRVTFDVGSESLRLIPSVTLLALEAMQVEAGIGGGLDLFQVAPLAVRASMAVFDPPNRVVDPVLTGHLLLRLRLASHVRMIFGFSMDYDGLLHQTTAPPYRPDAPSSSFEPWRLRAAVEFGLCVPLSGAGACADPR
jgi:hypothetical protein